VAEAQAHIDADNAEFWDELCGTAFARRVGVADSSAQSLARFDAAYLDFYPYLKGYLPPSGASGRVLEIGLGYGTLGQALADRGLDYSGLDIAEGPVAMMRHRLSNLGVEDPASRVLVGSALDIPHRAARFDFVYSIGCLHHTGDLPRAVSEVRRVLVPGGRAVVMLYNRHSLRRAALAVINLPRLLRGGRGAHEESIRGTYDRDLEGRPAPIVDYTSKREALRLFEAFSDVSVRRENFDNVKVLPREWFLGTPARLLGVDLYITATG
jgi:SAM-dependent methyltransferase